MRKFKSIIVTLLLLSSCAERKKVDDKNVFEVGDEWSVKDFSIEQYPTIIPFEKNAMVECLEEGLLDWQIVSKDTLLLKNKNRRILFHYKVIGDTMMILNKKRSSFELIAKRVSDSALSLKLVGLWRANLILQRDAPE